MFVWETTIYDESTGELEEYTYGIYATKKRAIEELLKNDFDPETTRNKVTRNGIPIVTMQRDEDETAVVARVKVIE